MLDKIIHNNTKAIICNSPPQSGKDEFARYLKKQYNTTHLEFKHKLIQLTKLIYDIGDEQWNEIYVSGSKDQPSELFGGKSARQALIYVSEKVIKPKFGKNYFGLCAARQLTSGMINAFSDGGFEDEIIEVVNRVGKDNSIIVRIEREGTNFSEDSRGYVNIEGVRIVKIDNNGSLENFYLQIDSLFKTIQP